MNQIQTIETKMTYPEFKGKFDRAANGAVENFVEMGFYLKYARDTDILTESPYKTIAELAKAEYGMDKSTTSRLIAINDRFAEGGYSDKLKEQYRSFGHTKLALMLTMPEEITEELSPSYSKAEIQAIKDEVDEEKAISDLEVMMEPRPVPAPADGLLNMLIRQLGEDSPELYLQMAAIMNLENQQEWIRKAKEILAPDAEKQYSIRISGTGRFLVSIRESEDTITTTSLRSLEKSSYTYQELRDAWSLLIPCEASAGTDYREAWEKLYLKEFPGKAKVAPVQQKKPGNTESKPSSRKESKVQKAPKPTPVKKTPPAKEKSPASELEKPENTGMELAQEQTAPEPEQTAPEPEQEPETPESTKELLLRPGMRVRNTGKIADHPAAEGTLIRQGTHGVWWIKYDGYSDSWLIAPSEVKFLEIIDDQSEQLPGQIGIEEAIAEAEERQGAVSYIEPDYSAAAACEPDEKMDAEWEKKKDTLDMYVQAMTGKGTKMSGELSILPADDLRLLRKDLIDMAALIEKELLRRGEKF